MSPKIKATDIRSYENFFQKKFINYIRSTNPESYFIENLSLLYGGDASQSLGLKYKKAIKSWAPEFRLDILQIDKNLDFHLWELKCWESPRSFQELVTGKVIGQIIFYDDQFTGSPKKYILKVISGERGVCQESISKIEEKTKNDIGFSFSSWNILVCGGQGWEILDLRDKYCFLKKRYLRNESPHLNVYQFCEVSPDDYDLRHISQLNEVARFSDLRCPSFQDIQDKISVKCPDGSIHSAIYSKSSKDKHNYLLE